MNRREKRNFAFLASGGFTVVTYYCLVAEIGVQIFSFTQLWKLKRAILKLSNTLFYAVQ